MSVLPLPQHPRLRIAQWSNLSRWDVNSGYEIAWQWPADILQPLGSVLTKHSTPVTADDSRPISLMDKISFGGQLFIHPDVDQPVFKGCLFRAEPGNLIFSKINVKRGSLAVVPTGGPAVAVSSEYPTFSVKTDVALPDYLALLLRSASFQKLLQGLANGGSTKSRVSAATLTALPVPLPPLPVQQAILDADAAGRAQAAALLAEANEVEAQVKALFADAYGLSTKSGVKAPKCYTLNWSEMERWSLNYLGRTHFATPTQAGKYPTVPLGKLAQGRSGGTPSKRNSAYWRGTIPWISPKDMKVYELHNAEDHISEMALEESAASLLPINSVMLVVRSGILRRLVPVGINRIPATINQDIRVFTVTDERLLPDFLGAYLRAAQTELLRLVKTGITVESINKEELEAFPIPLPPLEVQAKLLEQDSELRKKVATLRQQATDVAAETMARVEEMILGNR